MPKIKDKILKIHTPSPCYPVIKEIASRWSPRFFSDEDIPQKDLNSIFEAARFAPSAHNQQPWHFYFTHKKSRSYTKLFSTLSDYNKSWAKTAPVLILACAIEENKKGENIFAFYDLGAAVISLILQAQSLGYYSRQMALFDKEEVKKLFPITKNCAPYIIIAMGKIGNFDKAPQEIINYELDPRPRKTAFAEELK